MRDMLQHLWTGPISNAQVEILRGAKSVEARPLGVTKGGAVQRIMEVIAQSKPQLKPDFVFCAGHFMHRDEDIFSYFHNESENGKDGKGSVSVSVSADSAEGNQDKDPSQVLSLAHIFGPGHHLHRRQEALPRQKPPQVQRGNHKAAAKLGNN